MLFRIISTAAALFALALDPMSRTPIRLALIVLAIAALWSRWPWIAALFALALFLPFGLYILGGEGYIRLIGVMHLVVLAAALGHVSVKP